MTIEEATAAEAEFAAAYPGVPTRRRPYVFDQQPNEVCAVVGTVAGMRVECMAGSWSLRSGELSGNGSTLAQARANLRACIERHNAILEVL